MLLLTARPTQLTLQRRCCLVFSSAVLHSSVSYVELLQFYIISSQDGLLSGPAGHWLASLFDPLLAHANDFTWC